MGCGMMPFEGGALDLSHSIVQNKPLFVNDVRDITTNSAFPPRSDSCVHTGPGPQRYPQNVGFSDK